MLGTAAETVGRRGRLVELLRRADGGELPPIAFDDGDAFGAELRTMLGTDRSLRRALGHLHPLVIRATAVAPQPRWTAAARRVLATAGDADLSGAIRRTLSSLLRSDIVSRPDILVGGLRLANQRLARGLLWFASIGLEAPAELIGSVGVRMGTSGRDDAVVRDTAVANTCAALLGASDDPRAAAMLAAMRVRVTNRNVRKQVDRALEMIAARAGADVATIVELALPTFDLGPDGRLELRIGDTTAVDRDYPRRDRAAGLAPGRRDRQGRAVGSPRRDPSRRGRRCRRSRRCHPCCRRRGAPADGGPAGLESDLAGATVAIPLRGSPDRPASSGAGLIWQVGSPGEAGTAALPDGDGWVDVDGDRLGIGAAFEVRLWHPADADDAETSAWRAALAAATLEQPVKQAHREVFRPGSRDRSLAADRRFAGRVVRARPPPGYPARPRLGGPRDRRMGPGGRGDSLPSVRRRTAGGTAIPGRRGGADRCTPGACAPCRRAVHVSPGCR